MNGHRTRLAGTRRRQLVLGTAACLLATAIGARAEGTFPERPIQLVVPFPPGGASDLVARALQRGLGERLGQPVVVDNRAGAGGQLGAAAVARARPDGHTLLLASNSHVVNQTLNPRQPYDSLRDFTPVLLLSQGPLVLVVRPDKVEARSFGEFVALLRARPGKLSYASGGSGTITHLAPELLKADRQLYALHVPYKGLGPAMQDLLGGQVDFMVDTLSDAMPQIKAGKLLPLAVTSARRHPALPDVPTVAETIPGFVAVAWQALLAPAGVPADRLRRLQADAQAVRASSAMQAVLDGVGSVPAELPPAATAAFLAEELARWRVVVQRSGATAD